jgi:hypothetical protein
MGVAAAELRPQKCIDMNDLHCRSMAKRTDVAYDNYTY